MRFCNFCGKEASVTTLSGHQKACPSNPKAPKKREGEGGDEAAVPKKQKQEDPDGAPADDGSKPGSIDPEVAIVDNPGPVAPVPAAGASRGSTFPLESIRNIGKADALMAMACHLADQADDKLPPPAVWNQIRDALLSINAIFPLIGHAAGSPCLALLNGSEARVPNVTEWASMISIHGAISRSCASLDAPSQLPRVRELPPTADATLQGRDAATTAAAITVGKVKRERISLADGSSSITFASAPAVVCPNPSDFVLLAKFTEFHDVRIFADPQTVPQLLSRCNLTIFHRASAVASAISSACISDLRDFVRAPASDGTVCASELHAAIGEAAAIFGRAYGISDSNLLHSGLSALYTDRAVANWSRSIAAYVSEEQGTLLDSATERDIASFVATQFNRALKSWAAACRDALVVEFYDSDLLDDHGGVFCEFKADVLPLSAALKARPDDVHVQAMWAQHLLSKPQRYASRAVSSSARARASPSSAVNRASSQPPIDLSESPWPAWLLTLVSTHTMSSVRELAASEPRLYQLKSGPRDICSKWLFFGSSSKKTPPARPGWGEARQGCGNKSCSRAHVDLPAGTKRAGEI